MADYQVWHHNPEKNRYNKVAEVRAESIKEVFELTQNAHADEPHEQQWWSDLPEITNIAGGNPRSTAFRDIILDPAGVEFRVDGSYADFRFTEVTTIFDQGYTEHLAMMAVEDAAAIGFDMTGVDGRLETRRAPLGWESVETSAKLFEEWQVDYEAARLRDVGQDYEGFLRQANPELADYERSLRQSASRPKEQEKGHER